MKRNKKIDILKNEIRLMRDVINDNEIYIRRLQKKEEQKSYPTKPDAPYVVYYSAREVGATKFGYTILHRIARDNPDFKKFLENHGRNMIFSGQANGTFSVVTVWEEGQLSHQNSGVGVSKRMPGDPVRPETGISIALSRALKDYISKGCHIDEEEIPF